MRSFGVIIALAVACVCAPAWAAPLSAYGRLPTIEDSSIEGEDARGSGPANGDIRVVAPEGNT